jgi:ABC-type sugar transport system substrate-binding protein
MPGKRALVVTTVPADESSLREALPDADEIRVVAPAADVSFLQWLTNDEDDARRRADEAAERVASAAGGDAKVEIDRTSESTDAAQAIRDALRDFPADEIVVVTRPGDDSTWLEDETVQAALDAHGIPVRHRELSPTG